MQLMLKRPRRSAGAIGLACAALLGPATLSQAAMKLSLLAPDSSTSMSVSEGTQTVALDLRFDSDGQRVGSLTYYIAVSSAAVTYATPPDLTNASSPFGSADLSVAPGAGVAVTSDPTGWTVWTINYDTLNPTVLDYPAFNATMATYTFNIVNLAGDQSLVFTPMFVEMGNGTLGSPEYVEPLVDPGGPFTLNVTSSVPEPGLCLPLLSAIAAAGLRRHGRPLRL